MENEKRNTNEEKRFGGWEKRQKMTAEEAFERMYGEKSKEYPAEMKEEFKQMYDSMNETIKKVHDDRKAYVEKWKDTVGEDLDKGRRFGFRGEKHPNMTRPDGKNFRDFHGENFERRD